MGILGLNISLLTIGLVLTTIICLYAFYILIDIYIYIYITLRPLVIARSIFPRNNLYALNTFYLKATLELIIFVNI